MEYTIQNPQGRQLGRKVLPGGRATSLCLESRELFRLEGDRHGQLLQVTEGRVWLTETGNHKDVILEQGQAYHLAGRELVLLEGLPSARIRLLPANHA